MERKDDVSWKSVFGQSPFWPQEAPEYGMSLRAHLIMTRAHLSRTFHAGNCMPLLEFASPSTRCVLCSFSGSWMPISKLTQGFLSQETIFDCSAKAWLPLLKLTWASTRYLELCTVQGSEEYIRKFNCCLWLHNAHGPGTKKTWNSQSSVLDRKWDLDLHKAA